MQYPGDHKIIACRVRFHVHLFIHSNFLSSLGSQGLVESEVGRFWHFPPMRDFRFGWLWALKLYGKQFPPLTTSNPQGGCVLGSTNHGTKNLSNPIGWEYFWAQGIYIWAPLHRMNNWSGADVTLHSCQTSAVPTSRSPLRKILLQAWGQSWVWK